MAHMRIAVLTRAEKPGAQGSTTDARPGGKPEDDEPIWARREREKLLEVSAGPSFPWALYLLGSVLVAIAAVGSIFEFQYKNAVFGVLQPDSPLWAPTLLFMAITGIPLAGWMFLQGVEGFNDAAERQDRLDGYLEDEGRKK